MNRSFYNGVSGIKTHQFGTDVWADNIANINNTGYRAQTPEFSNIFSQTLANSYFNPVSSGVGLGSTGQTTAMSEKMGGLVDADQPFDMALDGEGWFGTSNKDGNIYYTRRGDFSLDGNGNLVARNGNFVLGSMGSALSADGTVQVASSVDLKDVNAQEKIQLPQKLTIPAEPTTKILYKGNLDPSIKTKMVSIDLSESNYTQTLDKDAKTISFEGNVENVEGLISPKEGDLVYVYVKDANNVEKKVSALLDEDLKWKISDYELSGLDLDQDLSIKAQIATEQEVPNTAQFSTDIITSSGEKNLLVMDFTKKIPNSEFENTWDVVVSIKDEDGKVLETQTGQIVFNGTGSVKSSTITSIKNGSTEMTLSLGTPYDEKVSNTGYDGITSIASGNYGSGTISKDGYPAGSLKNYDLDQRGQIQAHFDNGKIVPVAKIAVFHFQNDQGLTSEGGDYFLQSANSGKPIFYKDTNGNIVNSTEIKSQKLEMSNVNLATALTEIIVMQKAYTASSKSITTSDQMIQNAINLKR